MLLCDATSWDNISVKEFLTKLNNAEYDEASLDKFDKKSKDRYG